MKIDKVHFKDKRERPLHQKTENPFFQELALKLFPALTKKLEHFGKN